MAGSERNYSPHQQKIIKRYYDNLDTIAHQRLAELVGELYLAEGKKKIKVWKDIRSCLEKLGLKPERIDHLIQQGDPKVLAELIKEMG